MLSVPAAVAVCKRQTEQVSEHLPVAFARVLRGMDLDVSVDRVITYAQALKATGIEDRDGVYWSGRATLLSGPEEVPIYDAAFAAFWLGREPQVVTQPTAPLVDEVEQEEGAHGTKASAYEILRHKDFAAYSQEEFAEARRLMADLRLHGALRKSRRLRPGRRGQPDPARTIRRSLRTQGEMVDRAWRTRTQQRRRLILLCDVSGSMEPYARALMRFLHAAVSGRRHGRTEAFALGTRVTRVTRQLQWRDPDRAIAEAAQHVVDWSGGTRLGEGLKAFNDEWGVRGMARGATVVILSDGWERGDPATLAIEMARLRRVAHRIVWVNPLKASPGYEPLARGMAAALPYVDDFVAGHSLASLETLAKVIR
jgi:uncharacterized protein with von Willebrand factor type A (vWA) domain